MSIDLQPTVRIKEGGGQFTCQRLPYAIGSRDMSAHYYARPMQAFPGRVSSKVQLM